jgi:hypothetical protein
VLTVKYIQRVDYLTLLIFQYMSGTCKNLLGISRDTVNIFKIDIVKAFQQRVSLNKILSCCMPPTMKGVVLFLSILPGNARSEKSATNTE